MKDILVEIGGMLLAAIAFTLAITICALLLTFAERLSR